MGRYRPAASPIRTWSVPNQISLRPFNAHDRQTVERICRDGLEDASAWRGFEVAGHRMPAATKTDHRDDESPASQCPARRRGSRAARREGPFVSIGRRNDAAPRATETDIRNLKSMSGRWIHLKGADPLLAIAFVRGTAIFRYLLEA